jgi:hypothetical protein
VIRVDVEHAIGFLITICTLLAFGFAGLRWLRRWLRDYLLDPMANVQTEVSPRDGEARNGTLHEMVTRIGTAVDAVEQRFDDHLRYHDRGYGAARDDRRDRDDRT